MRILIVRNDKLGDFILSLPSFALLKASLPSATLAALTSSYTKDIAELSEWIDEVIIDETDSNSIQNTLRLAKNIRQYKIDAAITLYSTTRIGLTLAATRIKYRLAPATKIAQIFYTHTLKQRRSRSTKPEYSYNLDLAFKFLTDNNMNIKPVPEPPYLTFDTELIQTLKKGFVMSQDIKETDKIIFIHPGSGGSANNLTLLQYAKLAQLLTSTTGHTIVLTAGPNEADLVNKLSNLMKNTHHIVYHSKQGLINFSKHIAFADLFISGSTGPLHIAGALDVPTAAFYTRRRSATPLRWQTLNSPDRRLAFTPPETADEMDMSQIDIAAAAKEISNQFLKN